MLSPGHPDFLLGTDVIGRDYLSRLMMGGRTSITVHVETWARRRSRDRFGETVKVTEGEFTFVALGEDGAKREVARG